MAVHFCSAVFFVAILTVGSISRVNASINKTRVFPDDFKFGVATASYQIEGGWDEDGKGENIWDYACHKVPFFVQNNDTGDVACDSYHKWQEDVALLKDLGVNVYRFSLSWSRLLPTGFLQTVNEAGVEYYSKLIDALLENNIQPMVTLFHWDLPQPIQDVGGWTNPTVVDYYADYARVAFEKFGDRVKLWLTFNEPLQMCQMGYGDIKLAPGVNFSGVADYLCGHNLIKSHAKAYHIYEEEFKASQNGKVGITINYQWAEPNNASSPEDLTAAETAREFCFGWFANPIFFGDYPSVMVQRVSSRSTAEGFQTSRLPSFTDDEKAYVNGTYDFLGVNYYRTVMAAAMKEADYDVPSYTLDQGVNLIVPNATVDVAVPSWDGFRNALNWLKNTYNDPEIFITENGFDSTSDTDLDDQGRIFYLKRNINAISQAIEDGVNVVGYTTWSLMDNFEWYRGYNGKFGLYQVDFSSTNRTRTPKSSVAYYRSVIQTGNPQLYESNNANCLRQITGYILLGPVLLYAANILLG